MLSSLMFLEMNLVLICKSQQSTFSHRAGLSKYLLSEEAFPYFFTFSMNPECSSSCSSDPEFTCSIILALSCGLWLLLPILERRKR